MSRLKHHIFCLMGKSASGKDTIYEKLLQDELLGLHSVVPYTTRPIRSGEADGREYWFTTVEQFEEAQKDGKVIESRRYDTVYGPWYYYTKDDGQIDLERYDVLLIGTLESYRALQQYYGKKVSGWNATEKIAPGRNALEKKTSGRNAQGADVLVPLYIEAEDGVRLQRALHREQKRGNGRYEEMCRRFLADQKDFSEENLKAAGIEKRFDNSQSLDRCLAEVKDYIRSMQK